MATQHTPVKLRRRKTPSGLISLYLDIYNKGQRRYEYLRLYLMPETTRANKEANRNTLRLAEDIRAKRQIELRDDEFGFKPSTRANTLFYPYFKAIGEAKAKKDTAGTAQTWDVALYYLTAYDGNPNLTFKQVTPEWVKGFCNYLKNRAISRRTGEPLSHNSQALYNAKLRACLNQAVRDRVISSSPAAGVENIHNKEANRAYLTIDELQRLSGVECHPESVKRLFLFSCLTGLRRSDIVKLTWGEVQQQGAYIRLIFTQKKTGDIEYLDISPQAAKLMGKRGRDGDLVFNELPCATYIARRLTAWVQAAGIDKRITFHSGRHTFAVMMLDLGTDIYTVSKLLGHRNLSTTQIYAKILDKNKQAAVNKIPLIEGIK